MACGCLRYIYICNYMYTYLVGGFNPSEKYEFVSWDDEIPNIWKNKKWSKPNQICI